MTKRLQRAPLHAVVLPVAAASWLFSAPVQAAKWDAIEKLPGRTPVTILVERNPRSYFRIAASDSVLVSLEGPAQLRIFSRVEVPPGSKEAIPYELRVSERDALLEHQATESSASGEAHLERGVMAVGKSRRLTVDIPKGKHQVVLSVHGGPAVYVRLQHGSPKDGNAMVSLAPVEAPRSVLLAEGEKTISYYTAMPGNPVKLRVVGPTKLVLFARLDFDATMRGTQAYKLAISDGARQLRNVEFKTTKATTASYSNLPDRVPSKYDKLQLYMERGTHEITIALLEPAKSAEIHAKIPQSSVGGQK